MTTLISATLALSWAAVAPPIEDDLVLTGLGKHGRKVTTKSAKAQQFFNQGLALVYAFNHDEATKSFEAATRHDPNCAMAWWGLAIAQGPHVNFPMVLPFQAETAVSALDKAEKLMGGLPKVDQDLIRAAKLRYKVPAPTDRMDLDRAYANAMRAIWRANPKDADIGALYAESMMNLQPWNYWERDGKPRPGTDEVNKTLDEVLKLDPNHPLALHLAIHAWEASNTPGRAEKAADRLRNLQPGLGHMVHMPSHIDVRLGNWEKAIEANAKAIDADENYRKSRPNQGFYNLYMSHNRHMLGFAAMMIGKSKPCIEQFDALGKMIPMEFAKENAAFMDGYMTMPLEARIRFGKWDEVLEWPEYPDFLPLSRAKWHAARGVAYAAKGEVEKAELEQAAFMLAREKVPAEFVVGQSPAAAVMKVAEHMLNGEILLAKNMKDAAIKELEKAVEAEDQLNYDEPPDWIIPTRHILGVALLSANRPAEAEKVYRKDLTIHPRNGWSLYGLSEALKAQNKTSESNKTRAQFDAVWKNADTMITSSCMCVPDPKK